MTDRKKPPGFYRYARERMEMAGCPEIHIRHVGDVEPFGTDALEWCKKAIDEAEVIVLSSGVGVGKTAAVCWALAQENNGLFVKGSQLRELIATERERFATARLVAVDDLGLEPMDAGWTTRFCDLVDDWYGTCATVLITTNLTVEQFKKRYGDRVADRIRERGSFVTLKGESRRVGK